MKKWINERDNKPKPDRKKLYWCYGKSNYDFKDNSLFIATFTERGWIDINNYFAYVKYYFELPEAPNFD